MNGQTIVAGPVIAASSGGASIPEPASGPSFLDLVGGATSGTKEAAPSEPALAKSSSSKASEVSVTTEVKAAASPASEKKGVDALLDGDGDDDVLEKTAEPETEEADDTPATATTPEAKNAWSSIKKENKQLRAEVEPVKAELAKLKAELEQAKKVQEADPLKQEVNTYKQQLEALESEAAIWRVESTTAYKQQVTVPLKAIGADAVALATRNEINQDELLDALRETDPAKQDEALANIAESITSEREKRRLFAMADSVQEIYKTQDAIEKNAAIAMKEAQAREAEMSEKQKTESKASQMRAVAETAEKFKKVGKHFAVEGEVADDVVAAIANDAQATPWEEMSDNDKAFATLAAAGLPKMQRVVKALMAKVKSLESYAAASAGARPSSSNGSSTSSSQSNDGGRSFLEAIGFGS